jgi:hypothetical protein
MKIRENVLKLSDYKRIFQDAAMLGSGTGNRINFIWKFRPDGNDEI